MATVTVELEKSYKIELAPLEAVKLAELLLTTVDFETESWACDIYDSIEQDGLFVSVEEPNEQNAFFTFEVSSYE
jgi:hypothetical protein